jgi:predicted SAM-dependent methyltransferase
MKNYINLGCGQRYHRDWTNIDFVSTDEKVIAYDLSKGIPLENSSCGVVYQSHLLEHFPVESARPFLKECFRVLAKDGIIRVSVPDLESIVNSYLFAMNKAIDGDQDWAVNYEWIMIEMFDQIMRNYSGGRMAEYLLQEKVVNEKFIFSRCGTEARKIRNLVQIVDPKRFPQKNKKSFSPIFYSKNFLSQVKRFPCSIREQVLKIILGKEYETLNVGRFRASGEIHQWMYDRYSLRCLLKTCGFSEIIQRSASESYVPCWSSFNLDTELDGSIYKPDSLYMEAIKK